jgi:cytochrome c oxidase subunit II
MTWNVSRRDQDGIRADGTPGKGRCARKHAGAGDSGSMTKPTSRRIGRSVTGAVVALGAAPGPARAGQGIATSDGVLGIVAGAFGLQLVVFAICAIVAVAVFGAMIWSIVRHRSARGRGAATGLAHSMKAEIAWTAIPIAILVVMAIPAAATLIRADKSKQPEFSVTITGYQWKWEYDYLDYGIRYSSATPGSEQTRSPAGVTAPNGAIELPAGRPLVVPAGAVVRVKLTSNDVNHGWWVRDFGRRRNAIPGHMNEFSFRARAPGLYRGECTEFCGPGETCVPALVQALPPEEFTAWLAANGTGVAQGEPTRWDLDTTLAQGQMLHLRNCAGCHQASGQGLRAAGFPPLVGTPVSMDEHIRVAVHGRAGSAMTGFGPVLGDEELAAIVTYQRNAWGNDSGDFVAPADIAAAR